MSEACGFVMGCEEEGTMQVLSGIGGLMGYVCDDCADALNAYLERMAAVNQRLRDGESVPSEQVPRLGRRT